MEPLTKAELMRVRKVNEMKKVASLSPDFKFAYFPGGNLVLLKKHKKTGTWLVFAETGRWFDFDGITEQ